MNCMTIGLFLCHLRCPSPMQQREKSFLLDFTTITKLGMTIFPKGDVVFFDSRQGRIYQNGVFVPNPSLGPVQQLEHAEGGTNMFWAECLCCQAMGHFTFVCKNCHPYVRIENLGTLPYAANPMFQDSKNGFEIDPPSIVYLLHQWTFIKPDLLYNAPSNAVVSPSKTSSIESDFYNHNFKFCDKNGPAAQGWCYFCGHEGLTGEPCASCQLPNRFY